MSDSFREKIYEKFRNGFKEGIIRNMHKEMFFKQTFHFPSILESFKSTHQEHNDVIEFKFTNIAEDSLTYEKWRKKMSRNKKRGIRIESEKCLVRGKPHRRIIFINMLKSDQLPDIYKDKGPCVYMTNSLFNKTITYKTSGSTINELKTFKHPIPEDEFNTWINLFRISGERLMSINKSLRENHPEHFRREIETIVI